MKSETTKAFLTALIKQACADIVASVDGIIDGINTLDDLNYLNISIVFNGDSYPVIDVDKKYKNFVSYNDEIEEILFNG